MDKSRRNFNVKFDLDPGLALIEGSERGPVERGKRLRRLKALTEWWL